MAAQVVAAAGTAVARPLGGGSGLDAAPRGGGVARMPRERWGGAVAARGRRDRESQVVSVISCAPRSQAEVLPVSPDDDAAVKVA